MSAPVDPTNADAIAGNVALVQEKLLAGEGIAPDAWAEAIAYLDGFIERQRGGGDPGRLPVVLGSYLGEAMVQHYGGAWVQEEAGIAVEIRGGLTAFPFNKTEKQFREGAEAGQSIASFFDSVPAIIAQRGKSDA